MAAKRQQGPGVYKPLSGRAKQLLVLLRKAKHVTVQNAIIQELIHELQRGSRRARKSGGSFLDWLDGLGGGIENAGRGFARWWNRKNGWGTPQKRHCVDHPRLRFRNDLEYKAHLLEDKERAQSRSKGKDGTPQPSRHERAQDKARRVLIAAGHRPPESPKRQQQTRPAPVNGHQPKAPGKPLFTERELKEITARRVLDRDLRQAREARKRGDEAAAAQHEKQAERKRAEMRASGFKDTPLTEAQHKNLSARRQAQNTRVNGTPPRQPDGRYAPAAKPAPNGKPAPARAPVNGKAPAPAAKPPAMTVPANKHGVTRAKDLKAMQPGSVPKPRRKLTLRRAKQAPKAPPKAPAPKPAPKVTVPAPARPSVPPLPSQTVRAPAPRAPRRKLTLTRSR